MRLKSVVGICLIACSALALPFVTSAAPASKKRHANGMLVCECCGEPDCDCCEQKKKETKKQIADCGFMRPIRVASTSNNRPFGWVERVQTEGKTVYVSKGFGINMFEEIAKKLNLRYQIVGYAKDQDAITDLRKGALDLLIGVYTPYATVGKNMIPIYPAMFSNVFTVYYMKDKAFEVTGDESLNYKKGMIRRTENLYPLFATRMTPAMSITLETTESSFQKLLSGEADYLLGSPYSVEAELRRYKLQDDIVFSREKIMDAAMFMVLTRATDCFKLNGMLGKEIEAYNADQAHVNDEINKVIDAWGERFRSSPGMKETLAKKVANETQNSSSN